MTEQNKVVINLDGLDEIRKKLGKGYYAKVGILGNSKNVRSGDNDSGLTNAELGAIHEFGSYSRNIPARSFLRMPLETKSKDIVKFLDSKTIKSFIAKGNIIGAFKALGVYAEGIVLQAFSTGGYGKWQGLKSETVLRKGSSSPLIDTGQLRRSITSAVSKE